MENELSDGVISSKEPPKEHEILWEGRPFMPAYLLGGEGTLLFTIIVFAVLTYWGYTLIWLDCLMAAIVLFEWIQVIAHYTSRHYYITTRGTIVRRNGRYYLIRWQFINSNFEYVLCSFNDSFPFKLYTKSTHFLKFSCHSNKSD